MWIARIRSTGSGITLDKRQLLALCLCTMSVIFNGTTTVSLMPVYAVQLGADATMAGLFVATSFLAVTLGNIIGGWLSDKAGRKRFLIVCYAIGSIGLLTMIPATWRWQFWLSASLIAISSSASGVAQAYVADVVPPDAMGRGMSLFNSTHLVAGIVGSSGAGYAIQNLGTQPALLIAESLSVATILLLLRLRNPTPDPNVLRVAPART